VCHFFTFCLDYQRHVLAQSASHHIRSLKQTQSTSRSTILKHKNPI
jgi:hypothetical protein